MRGDWGKALAEISTYSLAIGLRKMVEMNRQTRLQAEVFVTLFVLGMAAAATTPASLVAWPFDPAAVDRFITAQMARHRLPGLAVAITRGDQVVLVRGYGEARDGE